MEIKDLFASCEVNWKIKNFVFAYTFNNYSILSPEIRLQGFKDVYWKMSLELHDGNETEIADIGQSFEKLTFEKSSEKASIEMPPNIKDTITSPEKSWVSFSLEIFPFSAKNLFVHWEMTITLGTKVFGPYERVFVFLEDCSKQGPINIATTNEIIQELLVLNDDTIYIHFYFIAYFRENIFKPESEKPLGMVHLYKDFKSFKDMEENYSDIKLKVQGKYIKAHKIVLSCNKILLENYIKKAVNDVVEISEFNYETLDAFVNFLYSQEVKDCLFKVSPSMIRCLNHFKCDALKTYYTPEEFSLKSKIQIKKSEFKWYVPDILHKTDNFKIMSPTFEFPCTSTTWRLTLSKVAGDRNTFMSIFAEITAGNRPRYFSLEFALINASGREFFYHRLLRNNESYDNLGFNEFVRQSDITSERGVVINDCASFLFRVTTSDGTQGCSVGCYAASIISPEKPKLYKQMSERLLDYYEKEMYHDILVVCEGRNYKVNRFILAARWPRLRQLLENNEVSINIGWIARHHISVCLPYLYTGVLNEESEVILELHIMLTSGNLNIPSLRAECEHFFKQRSA